MRNLILIAFFYSFNVNAQQLKLLVPLDSIRYVSDKLTPYIPANTDLFISGETHGINEANDAKIYHLFTYLNKYYGIKNLMWEAGLAYNYYLHEYLKTGDTSLLSLLTVNGNLHTTGLFTHLYSYNKSVEATQKINSLSIDLDFWDKYEYPLNCLKYILKKHQMASSALFSVSYINALTPSYHPIFIKKLDTLNTLVKIDSLALKEKLGDCFLPFYHLCYRLRVSAGIMNKRFFAFDREPLLTKHYQEIVNTKQPVFTQFGDAHLPSNKLYNPFTARIVKANPNYKITVFHSVYINCYSNYGSLISYSHSTYSDPLKKFKALRKQLSVIKGSWLAVIEQKNGQIDLVIISSNYR